MAKTLVKLLEENSDQIVARWVKLLEGMESTVYATTEEDKLESTWAKCFEAYLEVLKSGNYGKIHNFVSRISLLRGEAENRLTEAQKGLLAFKEACLDVLEKNYHNDTKKLTKATRAIDICVNHAVLELSKGYERHVKKELAKGGKLTEAPLLDALTGVYNYTHFEERLHLELRRAQRYERPLSIVIFDIDYFRNYNDAYGRPNGDIVLKKIVELLGGNSREVDIVARFGEEEFIVALPETEKMDATIMAERVRKVVEETVFSGEETQPEKKITVSGGVANFPQDAKAFDELVNLANRVLQQAKEQGRNRICFIFD